MSREWKPGDVALLEVGTPSERIGLRARANDGWRTVAGHMSDVTTPDGADFRPLVVINPEDREQVGRLSKAIVMGNIGEHRDYTDAVQAALREFANPTPPKPEEPTGLGAVVEDAEGYLWVKADSDPQDLDNWRRRDGAMVAEWRKYSAVDAVRVLSEGVQ